MSKNKENLTKIVLGLLSMVFLIYIGSTLFKKIQVDITEEKLYTLSSGTIKTLKKIDSPIQLKLYYSKTAANKGTEGLRAFNNYYNYVQELLRQYVSHSQNNLTLETIDPRPDTDDEQDAISYGLKKFQLTETEIYFFGLVAENETGTEKIIEFFDPGQKDKLEYTITKLLYTVLKPQMKTIGFLSPLEVISENSSPYMMQIMRMQGKQVTDSWGITKTLGELYKTKKIPVDTDSITGIDLLVIIHPKGFSEETLFAIDQFLLKGGKLLIFVDPYATIDQSSPVYAGPSSSPDPSFNKLLDKWGIVIKPGTFSGDKTLTRVGQFSPNIPPSKLLPLINCNEICTAPFKDSISAGSNNSLFVFPGALEHKSTKSLSHSVILATSDKGNTYIPSPQELGNPPLLMEKFSEGNKPVPLAYKVIGKFSTAFPSGRPKSKKKNEDKKEVNEQIQTNSLKETAIIVFADVDFIADQYAFKNSFLGMAVANDNSTLFLNSVESLTGDLNLMSVRSKGRINRDFDVVSAIESEAEKNTEAKVKQINQSIGAFQAELNQLGQQATQGNIAIIQNEGVRKKKALEKNIAKLKKELRAVKREGREKIEKLGKNLQYINTLLVPLLIAGFGTLYHRRRNKLMAQNRK